MLNKYANYSPQRLSAKPELPPQGAYQAVIRGARVEDTAWGGQRLIIALDITEGEYAGRYTCRGKEGYAIMTHKMNTAINDYMNMLTDELRTRQFTDEEIKSLIQISGIKECILKFPEESLHYPVESTADEILQIVCRKAIERFAE